jgi:hypothetical protein
MSRDPIPSSRTLFVALSLVLSAPLFVGCGNAAQPQTGSGGVGGSGGSSDGGSGGGGTGGASNGGSGGASNGGTGGASNGGSGGGQACDVAPVDIAHGGSGAPSPFTMHLLDLAAHPDAVCNDGTPGSYQVRPGFGKGTKRWLIYLEGGGECATAADCKARYKATKGLMSSEGEVDGGTIDSSTYGGIKSTSPDDNPDFYDANFVQLNYCSSDAWSGDKAGDANLPDTDVGHWSFRGRKIVEAVVSDLLKNGLAQADEVFLMGSSAGGVGVLNHADDVRAALPASTRFVALQDAGFIIDYPSYDPATMKESTAPVTDLEKLLAISVSVWGGRGDKSCEEAAKDDTARMLCRSPSALLLGGHVTSPLFVRQSQLDAVQLKRLISPGDKSTEANAYRERFAAEMRTLLGKLAPAIGVYSPHDKQHGVINDTMEWSAQSVGGKKLPPTIGAFYRDPCGAAEKDIETP